MHGGSHRHLDSFQVQPPGPSTVLKDDAEQTAYFAFDFLPDRFRRFFSCVLSVSATDLAGQIFSFTASRSWLSSRNR
jgi:hypothetical protein